jgi:hypothetical protein
VAGCGIAVVLSSPVVAVVWAASGSR